MGSKAIVAREQRYTIIVSILQISSKGKLPGYVGELSLYMSLFNMLPGNANFISSIREKKNECRGLKGHSKADGRGKYTLPRVAVLPHTGDHGVGQSSCFRESVAIFPGVLAALSAWILVLKGWSL